MRWEKLNLVSSGLRLPWSPLLELPQPLMAHGVWSAPRMQWLVEAAI